jgi:Sulfotransferase family
LAFPDFIIVGAPKAGSTALHAALSLHPDLWLSTIKEPKFFMCDGRPPPRRLQRGPGDAHSAQEWVWRRQDYEALFDAAPPTSRRGESTPLYLSDPAALSRIAVAIPAVKLIAVVRDPIDRAYSNWTHLWCDGLEPIGDFLAACDAEQERISRGWAPFWRYLGLGRYGEQLRTLYGLFPREQVYLLRYRELVDTPGLTLDRICEFLGVRPGLVSVAPAENVSTWVAPTHLNGAVQAAIRAGAAAGSHLPPQVWRQASRPLLAALHRKHASRPPLAPAVRAKLLARVADDIELLEAVTGSSYGDWLSDQGRGAYSVRKATAF